MRYNKAKRRFEYDSGEKVKIASRKVLKAIHDNYGERNGVHVTPEMLKYAGRKLTIGYNIAAYGYKLVDGGGWTWTPDMFENPYCRAEHNTRIELYKCYQNMIEDGFEPSAQFAYLMDRFVNEPQVNPYAYKDLLSGVSFVEKELIEVIVFNYGEVYCPNMDRKRFGEKCWDTYLLKFNE